MTLYAYLRHALPLWQPYHRPSLRSSVGGCLYTSPSRALHPRTFSPPRPTHITHITHQPTSHTATPTSRAAVCRRHTYAGNPLLRSAATVGGTYHPLNRVPQVVGDTHNILSRETACRRHTYAGNPRLRSAATVGGLPDTPPHRVPEVCVQHQPQHAENKCRAASRPPYTRKIVC